ncbi:phosphotransferase family protein [Alkalimarinus coralli]|uniref:phosphotransferase family protein n=1 Tax=Alkalimarinus coralli TaxID=2935863 RepID=UPI00202B6E4D|nr:phosphotransferase [Alkalimarinus coralli]
MAAQPGANTAIINSVNAFLGKSVVWTAIETQGTSNHHFRGLHEAQNLILRINATKTVAFGASRQSEAMALELIQDFDWSPTVIKNNWQEGWCLMQDHGSAVASETSQTVTSQLLASIAEWQTIAVDSHSSFDHSSLDHTIQLGHTLRFNYATLFETYRNKIENSSNISSSRRHTELLDQLIDRFDRLPTVPLCLTHHDLHPGNLCLDGHQLIVLDWEYAGFGNPWFDAASLCGKFGITADVIGSLPAFKQIQKNQLTQGLTNALWLTKALETLWYAVRGSDGVHTQHD